ncbi:MAG TPA: DUF2267 domain-containing protein [Solirubrobacteraceae bacterium]|jgi:uncharacterized protein (DUF2267 family)|nr:DUF2267 domain-containing protein [Solirubrobacteraceae bacterium]
MARGQAVTEDVLYWYTDEWRYERFITTIEQRAAISWNAAERAARATLMTLAERISGGEARELARELPPQVGKWLEVDAEDAEDFDAREFLRRVAEREEVDEETAAEHVKAVFAALARLVRGEEITRLAAQLPSEYRGLLSDARRRHRDPAAPEILSVEIFAKRVARHGAIEVPDAQRAGEAVLETLAERVAGGEADDLAEQLPDDLRRPLERGKERSGGKAQKMSLDEFVARIAEREGVSYEQALEHARAVFATLRETLTDNEFSDLLSELPRGYQEALL